MKIIITNLETWPDRKKTMEKQLVGKGYDYEFQNCVVGANLTEEEIAAHWDMDSLKESNRKVEWINRGIIGCTLTNRQVYQRMITEKRDAILYLEDDIKIPDNFLEVLNKIEKEIKQGDVVLLYYLSENLKLDSSKCIDITDTLKLYQPIKPFQLNSGAAFIVTRKAAEKMLNVNTPIKSTPDIWGFFERKGAIDRLYCCYPRIVDTMNLKSTMGHGKFYRISSYLERNNIFPFNLFFKIKRRIQTKHRYKVEVI